MLGVRSIRACRRSFQAFATVVVSKPAVRRNLSCASLIEKLRMSPTPVENKVVETLNNGSGEDFRNGIQFLKDWKEITIPVPWGVIAGKAWGDPSGCPILGLHGWQDNAGTFDRLAPLLPDRFYFVAIDFPGHGLSSPYPPGMTYAFHDMLLHVRFIVNHLQWKKFSLLGHSMGGAVSMMFGALMPSYVDRIISIDLVKPMGYDTKIHPEKTVRAVMMYFDVLKKMDGNPPSYSYEDAKKRLLIANAGSITPESADILMIRGTKKTEDGEYYFSRDLRQTLPGLTSTNNEQLREILSRISVPFMLIKGKQGPLYEPEELYDDFISMYRESSPQFEYVEVEGTHHVHLNTPENVAPHVIRFLEQLPMAAL